MEIYLDNSATTPCYESVRDLVGKVMCEDFGNPSSMHRKGIEAEKYIKQVKKAVFEWRSFAEEAGLSLKNAERIEKFFN